MCFGVDTWLVDSAFARFWRILRGGLAHYRLDKSLRPPLESHQNHRKILESCAICLKAPESSCFLSLRDFRKEVVAKQGVAAASLVIHKNNTNSSGLLHCVRNDGKKWILGEMPESKQAARRQDFGDRIGAFQGLSRARTWRA